MLCPASVTLSRSERSVALGSEMLRCAQQESDLLCMLSNNAAMLSISRVKLSNAKDLARWAEMLSCAQHDPALP